MTQDGNARFTSALIFWTINAQFTFGHNLRWKKNNDIQFIIDQAKLLRGFFCKSGIVIFAWRVTWKYPLSLIVAPPPITQSNPDICMSLEWRLQVGENCLKDETNDWESAYRKQKKTPKIKTKPFEQKDISQTKGIHQKWFGQN